MCRHKMCSFGLVCMFHKIWDINYEFLLLRLDLFLLEHYFIRYTMKQLVAVTKQGEI